VKNATFLGSANGQSSFLLWNFTRRAESANDLPQPQPPGSQAPTKAREPRIARNRRKQKGRRLLAAGSGLANIFQLWFRVQDWPHKSTSQYEAGDG
jgi:hypothetical protein